MAEEPQQPGNPGIMEEDPPAGPLRHGAVGARHHLLEAAAAAAAAGLPSRHLTQDLPGQHQGRPTRPEEAVMEELPQSSRSNV